MQQIFIPLHIHICTMSAEMLHNTMLNNLHSANERYFIEILNITIPLHVHVCMYTTCRNIAEQKVKQPACSQLNLIY